MGITHPKFRAAVVQAAPVWLDLEGTVAKTIAYIEEAASEGAKLSRFPRRGFLAIRGTSGSERRPGRSREDSSSVTSTIRSVTTALSRGKIAEAARDNRITVVLGLSE